MQAPDRHRGIDTARPKSKRAFTLIEVMIVVAILGILASVAVPALLGYIRRSKAAEVPNNLKTMYYQTRAYFDVERSLRTGTVHGTKCLVDEAGASFLEPASPGSVKQRFRATSHPSWLAMGFTIEEPVYYGYTFLTDKTPVGGTNCVPPGGGATEGNVYTLRAHGDLDDDGTLSTFELSVYLDSAVELTRAKSFYIIDETE